jgi:predicted RNA methylase
MADNRYYYFKDAKGNRHTVDKTAYDKDPMGFAKAFPGARMEVIDRKTGRRGDVNVKDASRVGDFGAHLFTGRTITRGKGKPNSSALGRAQQSVAQEKWGGGVVTHENTTASENVSAPKRNAVTLDDWNGGTTGKESELVKGLRAADTIRKRDEEQMPIDYTKPGAVKQMVGGVRRAQKSLERRMEQAGQEAGRNAEGEIRRRNAPAFDLGNENVNNNLVKTRGQLEDELEESSRQLVDKQLGGYINNSIQKMFKDATVKGVAAEDALSKASPFAYMAAGKAYNEALDPDKLMNQLSKNAEKDMAGLFSDPKMQKEIVEKAASLGIDPEDYVKNYIAPGLQAKIAEEFEKSELSRNMPKSTAEYIIRGVNDSMIGTILSMGMMSKKQRQYAQQGMAMTDNGENPYVKPGMGARVARGTLSFAADAPVFGALGKAGAAVAGKVMGNGVAQAARIANTSLRGRIVRMATAGAVSQGVTGVLYGSTNAAVQNYSTGDDTSIGNTVKLMTMGGLSEGASWATMGGIGGAVGAGIYNVSGVKRIPAKVFQLAMEGVGMHMGGNVAKMIEGHDTDWLSVEGNLEACANVVALKLTHARLPKRYAKDGKKESYLDMVKRNLANLMVSDGQRASFGGYTFTNEEKEQLFGSNKAPLRKMYERLIEDMPLRPEGFTHWALRTKKTTARGKGEESYKDTDAEFVKTAYDEIMADNTIPWDTKAKFSALVMGTVPSSRPMMEYIGYGGGTVSEYSKYGELLSEHIVKTEDERDSVVYSLRLRRENQRLSNAYGAAQIKDEKVAQETLETVAETFGFTAEQLKAAMDKDPLKRSEEEQNACVALRKTYEGEQFPEGTLHPEQSQTEGKDVVEENNLGTENPNNEAVAEVLNNMNNAEKAFNAALESNDVLKQEYERLAKEGLSEPQIYMELINSGLTQEQLVPFADYINTKAKAVGMYRGTEQKIAETVQKHVEQWSYKGELNGEKQEGGQMLFVKDNNGRVLIVGAGDVAFDNEGRARESVGDMLSVLDPNTKEMDFVSKKDVQLDHVEKTEDYAKNYQEMLEVKNSVAYAESEKGKEKSEESDTKTESVVTPKEGASAPGVEDVKPIGEGEKKNPSDNGNGSNETLTFADGSPVPMMKDTKGRETADYSQMTPEHGAEWMSSQFGENAEAAVDGQIKRAEKMLKEAEKIKVDYTGDLNDAKEAEAQKTKAVDAAKAELELYTNIKKVMTANKVKAGMEKVGSVGEEGSVGSVGEVSVAVREKFEKSKKIPGRRGSITLPDGTKITGQYFYGEVSGLTPSHDPFNDFKQNEGFPVNEDGSSSNSRSYKDKESRLFTEKIGRDFGGQALKNVPVVQDGILLSGNGTTMGKQLAERYGTDGKYYESLSENAEGFGWTPKQIEEAGFKGTVYFVPDKKMPLTSKTFDLFNRQETKSIGNTEQSVKNAKVLSTDEVGAIIAEIEGSGSLDAFFNNPTAINSLLKRLIDKGVIGLNEVAGLREGEDKLSAAGKDFVKNLLLGSVFSENTIRMMGADAMLKTKALNGIRAVTDNMKLGDYALMKEIDQAVQLLYEARQGGSGVDAYLRTPAMFGENAADRFDPISQAIALALEGKAEDFRELMMAYNRNAAPYADANQMEMFGERPTNEEFIKEFLKLRNWKDYETRHSSKEGNGDAGSSEGTEPQAPGGNVITSEADYNKAVEQLKEVKGEERERILDQMGEYVKEFAKSNGYDEPVVLRTKQDLADAAKTENDKTIIENMPEGAHYPGYYEDGKIHIYLEGSTGSEELRETFEHESVHADNEVDPSRVEALVYSITDMNTLTREELERVVEVLSNMKEYTERASEMDDVDALYMLADEALAHLVTYAQEHGKDAMSEITDNPTLLNIAEKSLKERENDRRRKEGLAKSGDKTLERKNLDDVSTEENGGALEGDKEGKPENDNGGSPDRDIQAGEEQREVDKAVKNIATEITKKTGIEVVTDEKEAEEVIRESEETDSDLKYHKETDEATLEELENGETVKVYRAMQVIDGKLYPPMAAAVNGKRVEANELGVWIRADENPDLAIPDIDPKTKEQKVDKKTGELKWKFKLDKGGKDATGKKATDIPAAYNPYWHTSRSPLNDQFKSAWIRPNIVVVECEVPVSELSSGYKAERAKDAVGEVDWKSGVVSGEVYKQTGRARKVILSRWCKPVRVLSDAEVAQRAKEFVGDAKVEIPENVLTPRQRIEFEKVGFKIGAPEKGVKKSDQINEALKRGLQIDNSVKEFRTKDGEVYGFTDGEKIYLDTRKMKPETPLHEYAHLWCDMLRRVNPKEWESVKKLFDKVEGLKEEVQKLYPELEGDALYEEMITTYSGREGTKKLEDVVRKLAAEEGKSVTESVKAQGFLEKVKEALTKYWKGVADMLGIHFTTAEEVADKVLADWAKGVDPRGSEKGKVKSEESDSKVEGEEPSKTNPLAWLAHTAEMFKDEQIQKAREELTAAKESGDASDIKRATEKMKQAMETKLRGNGIGLVERRRIIGRELGKLLGEEAGKTEAEKIDKPWKDMDGEERMATAEKNPLTEEEIRNNTSEENKSLIDDAVDYVNGNHGIVQQIAYLKIYDDVRNRHEDAPDNSGAEDRTQLAATDNGGSKELGVETGREGGGSSEQLGDGTSGEGRPEQLQHGSQNSTGQPDVPTGEGSHSQGEGEAPGLGGVPTGNTQRERGSNDGSNGATVRHERGRGSSDKTATTNGGRKPTAKQGTHFPDNGTLEQKKQNTAAKKAALKDALKNWAKLGRGELGMNLAGLNSRQIEYLPEVMKAVKDYGVALIDEGIYRVKDWIKSIREAIGEDMKGMKFSDKDIDGFIEEMWNSKYTMNGETHTIGEWADIYGQEKLRKELAGPLTDKAKRQIEVEDVPVKIGDKANIEETLPFLLPQQQEDVLKAETQFFGNEHADREHAYGKGYMFTNGTGTGKTYTGLGIAKRLVKQGKGRILIVTPSQKKVSDWIKDGHNLNMEIRDLDSWAKDRGTTATTESGEGVVITTFANFGVNKKLLETKWDAVIYDESHRIMENKKGTETARSMQHYMVTNRDENHCFLRLQEINKDYQKQKSLGEQFDIERAKETERIRKEYKASHPSATERDVAYATSRMVPRDVYNFTPSDYVTFPKLGKIHAEYVKALSHYTNEVKPKLEAQAKTEWKDTKTIFLSATPFNTRENLDYVEGYIFKYPEGENSGRMSGRTQFYLDHFGAGYKFRFNRLEQSTSNPEAVAKQEIAFSDYLQHTLGTMSGRIIDSPYDYSRDFPTVSPDHAERFNQAVQEALTSNSVLAEAYRKTIGDYNYGSALFETMKVANIIERIKAHLDAGRKIVIFHRRVDTKEPIKPPFAFMLEKANRLITIMNEGEDKKNEAIQAVRDFRKKYADLLKWEQTLDYSMPREQIAKVFGKDNVLFFSGKESTKVKDKAVDTFNDDNSGKNIIVIQEASGKEGISLHDKTGEHQRVCITLALPQSPITALQIEGRTYRIGNKSNAIFEYPILGLNSEMMLFGQKFNNQVSTTENLALGSQARSLRDSFANGILEHSGVVPIDQQGVGGKEFDAPKDQSTDGFDNAVLDYYSNQKLNSRNREGVDYFPTPEPLGYKMMEWANMGEGDTVMEPSAGHGAIARYAPKGNQMVAIEPSQSLFAKLQLKAGGLGRKFVNTIFENYDISNKHDVVVMNPPFGTAGATAIAHLGKAFKHLEEGGRVVAIIPRGSTDKKFDKWIEGEKTAVMRAEVELPDIVFKQAGTKVVCRVVVVDKISNEAMRAKAGRVEKVSLGGHYDKIEDFFEDLRDIEIPDRIIDTNTIMQKKSKQTAKDLKELKDVTVNLNEHGINVHVRGDRNDYSIMFDLGEYNAEQRKSILSGTYERFEEYERYTRDETSQAVIAELKKLTCKLAGMTEEEMQRYLKKQNDGKGVMYRMEHAAEVYGKANAHYRMELGNTFSDSKEHFDAVRDRAVEEKGIVMPNLNKEKVKVVEVEKHLFGENKADAIKNARTWAKDNLATKNGDMPTMRDGTPYIISKAAIDKYLSNSAISKSDDPFVHLSVLIKLTDVIHESIEAEIHADYKKGEDGMRSVENGYGEGVLVHRLYGAVEIDGKMYRVKTTMQEFRGGEENKPHSYEVTKIELLDSPGKRENPDRPPLVSSNNSIDNKIELPDAPGTAVLPDSSPLDTTPSNSKNITSEGSEKANESDSLPLNSTTNGYISTAKLLQGVEKSYDSGKKLLDESKDLTDGETFFRKEGNGVVTPEKTSNAMSERIIKTVEKVAKRTGGKVKMVNSVEEIENPKVRKDIENGKQVTGWYDENTGEVHLYMPNIHDTYTAEKTVWHETVGHKGMRGLLGDKFDSYMRSLWMDLDNPINAELRAYEKEKMNMNHLGFYDAIEEFIAKSAEDGKGEPGFWNYIKNKVTDALHEIGYRVSPNVKDVKYMLWLAKNVQKYGDSPLWKLRAEAVRWKIEHEKTEYTKIEGGELYDNDGKSHDFEGMSREEWLEATDGEIHYRTAPSAATALDRYHHALDRHSYMATEAFMDNMLSLKKLMEAIDPSIRKIEDVNSSMNPYLMQNITEGMMSDKSKLFEIRYMDPLSKAMSSVLDSFDGKKVEDRIRNFNLYMIRKHGLERNRVLFVRDWIREERKVKSEESDSIDALETAWKDERSDLRQKLDSGQIDLKEYYRQMDEWIVQNLDKDFKAEEHDYSGMHGLQGIADKKAAYDDAGAIDEVMSQEASMESMKKGSVADFWKKVKAATDYSVNSDYESGLISQITHDGVLGMFDWYVPLRKFDEATAEDVYGYVTEMGDPSNYIGTTLMNAKGRKSLSNVEILAQIGLMGNRAIRNGGQNMIKQAFARFVRNSGEQNLVKETKVWVEKTGTDLNGNDIWEEAYPQIPEGASADDVASIVDAFETDMRTKQAKGEAKSLSNGTDIGFKFQRAKDKSQHFVDVKIAGRTHRFVVLGNPRAAQALNGMLENGKASVRSLQAVTRWMAMASTSWSPEFVMRNIVRDMEFASSHVAAKEGERYLAKWSRYYGELNPLNMFYNEGAGSLKSMKMKDFKNGVGYGLYARYREGTLGNSKMERYFKEFMENGGETGFVQLFSMHDMEKSYKSIVEKESAKGANKIMVNAVEVLKKLGKNVENLNEVAENMARFATYCTSRDLGRSAARSAYDAKEVSTNFNRHGSGDAIKSFKNGEMGDWQKARRNTYGFVAGYLRNYSMFFNAGIQSTNLLFKNIKRAPVGTTVAMTSAPFALALIMAAVNNAIIQNEDDKDRGNVKDPYGELPDYIRRNNLCIYVGNNKFVTVPLAIELRAFYSLGDLAAGQTFAKNVKSQRNMAMDAVGCMSQLFPVMDFLNNPNYEKSLENGVGMTTEGIAPTAIVPFIEWWLNNDWKGAPIRRTGDKTELNPAWQNAYNNVPARLVDLNKWVNAKTNNMAPGNPEMKGNEVLDWATDPSMLNHFFGSWSGGMGTFTQRTAGLGAKATTGKTDEIEVGDVPFLRSLFYTPREQSSMARTKAKWYNYKEEMEQTIANNDKLKSKNVPTMKRIENAAALEKFEGSPEQRKVNIIKNAEKRMRHWNTMRKKWADDKKQVDFANKNIEMIMQEAVEDLDRIE